MRVDRPNRKSRRIGESLSRNPCCFWKSVSASSFAFATVTLRLGKKELWAKVHETAESVLETEPWRRLVIHCPGKVCDRQEIVCHFSRRCTLWRFLYLPSKSGNCSIRKHDETHKIWDNLLGSGAIPSVLTTRLSWVFRNLQPTLRIYVMLAVAGSVLRAEEENCTCCLCIAAAIGVAAD